MAYERHGGKPSGQVIPHLREWRIRAALTQAELGDKIGRTKTTISLLEKGNRASLTTIRKLAETFGITPARLLSDEHPE